MQKKEKKCLKLIFATKQHKRISQRENCSDGERNRCLQQLKRHVVLRGKLPF